MIPEVETDPELIAAELRWAYDRGKAHAIVVVAEGAEYNAESWRVTSRSTASGWASTCE